MESKQFYAMCLGFGAGVASTFGVMQYYIQENYVNTDDITKHVRETGLHFKVCNDLKMYDKRVVSEFVIKSGFTHLVCEKNMKLHGGDTLPIDGSTVHQKETAKFSEIKPISSDSKLDELLNPKPQIPDPQDSRPLPKEILQKLDSVALESPYQAKELANPYIGQEVRWTVYFKSISHVGDEESLLLQADPFLPSRYRVELPSITLMVNVEEFPRIKSLSKGEKLIVTGRIDSVSNLSIHVRDVEIKI